MKLPDACIILHIKSQLTLTKRWLSTAHRFLGASPACAVASWCQKKHTAFLLELFPDSQAIIPNGILMLPGNSVHFFSPCPLPTLSAQLLIPQICAF